MFKLKMKTNETPKEEIAQAINQQDAQKEEGISKEQEIQDLTDLLKRTQANFENYRKQTEKRIEEYQQFATKDLLLKLLPLLDNFDLALKASSSSVEDLKHGIELIYSQLFQILEDQGMQLIKTEKQKFDPYQHEALMKETSDKPEGVIIEELQKGFTLNGKVIRHAKVKISSGKK